MFKIRRKKPSPSSISSEVDKLSEKHHSLRPYKTDLRTHHENYPTDYKNRSIVKDPDFNFLKNKYADIRSTIINLFFDGEETGACVFCGLNFCSRLDHFYPKKHAPQYSLVPSNLFWVCNLCNEKKGAKLPISDLKLFHPLFDKIFRHRDALFEVKLKRIELDTDDSLILALDVVPVASLSQREKKRVNVALNKLKIKDRIIHRVDSEIRAFYNSIETPSNGRIDTLMEYCKKRASFSRKNDYTGYFAYKILSRRVVLRKLLE